MLSIIKHDLAIFEKEKRLGMEATRVDRTLLSAAFYLDFDYDFDLRL
jgi:hypothetical protein